MRVASVNNEQNTIEPGAPNPHPGDNEPSVKYSSNTEMSLRFRGS